MNAFKQSGETNRLQLLFEKYLQDSLTAEEAEELEKHIDNPALEFQLRNGVREIMNHYDERTDIEQPDIDTAFAGLEMKVNQRIAEQQKVKTLKLSTYLRYAAAVAIAIFSLGVLIYTLTDLKKPAKVQLAESATNDIAPGTNRATLTLANGEKIKLNETKAGIDVTGNSIRYENGGVLVNHTHLQNLTLSVPRAGKYKLKLSDGTKVWLNAASSLSYPSSFEGKERVVEVTGEVYFEVTHDTQHPFVVKTAQQRITVLGTAFNVNTYTIDRITTTLVNGRVALSSVSGLNKVINPGDQAILNHSGFEVKKVNTQDYIAWKDDLLVLNDQDLHDILRQLERWYDIEFINMETLSAHKNLSGEIPRNTSLSAILQALEEQIHVKFEINGRRIMIKT